MPAGRFSRRKIGTCPMGCVTFAYDLPVRLDESVLPFLEPLGKSTLPFGKTSILRLECGNYTVTGIRRLKEVRVLLKPGAVEKDMVPFEAALEAWLVGKP
jgi:hypothetical protein